MSAGQLAALIAAAFWAAGVCVGAYVLIKLARLLTEATRFLSGLRDRTDVLIDQAHAAIDRTNQQLDMTDAITANMDEVSADVAELTGHVTELAGMGRALAAGPVGKIAAVGYGVRRAVSLRRAKVTPGQALSALPAPGPAGRRSAGPAEPIGESAR